MDDPNRLTSFAQAWQGAINRARSREQALKAQEQTAAEPQVAEEPEPSTERSASRAGSVAEEVGTGWDQEKEVEVGDHPADSPASVEGATESQNSPTESATGLPEPSPEGATELHVSPIESATEFKESPAEGVTEFHETPTVKAGHKTIDHLSTHGDLDESRHAADATNFRKEKDAAHSIRVATIIGSQLAVKASATDLSQSRHAPAKEGSPVWSSGTEDKGHSSTKVSAGPTRPLADTTNINMNDFWAKLQSFKLPVREKKSAQEDKEPEQFQSPDTDHGNEAADHGDEAADHGDEAADHGNEVEQPPISPAHSSDSSTSLSCKKTTIKKRVENAPDDGQASDADSERSPPQENGKRPASNKGPRPAHLGGSSNDSLDNEKDIRKQNGATRSTVAQGKQKKASEEPTMVPKPEAKLKSKTRFLVRAALITALPDGASESFISNHVFGGPLEAVTLGPAPNTATVSFLHIADCAKFIDGTRDGLLYDKARDGRELFAQVEPSPDEERTRVQCRELTKGGATRCLRAVGTDDSFRLSKVREMPLAKELHVEMLHQQRLRDGSRRVDLRFRTIYEAVAFKAVAAGDRLWSRFTFSHTPDPCDQDTPKFSELV